MPKSPNDLEMWEQAVRRLIDLTNDGTITWEPLPEEFRLSQSTEMRVLPPVFASTVQDKSIVVFEYAYKYYTDGDDWRFENDIGICFSVYADGGFRPGWTWPATASRHALWDAIKFRQSGAGDFLEQLLGKSMVG